MKKEAKKTSKPDEKAFLDMLRTANRNHYTLNQMVDRKARIVLSADAVILSLIIGKIITNHEMHNGKFILLLFLGVCCLISIIYAMLATLPEKVKLWQYGSVLTTDWPFPKGFPSVPQSGR